MRSIVLNLFAVTALAAATACSTTTGASAGTEPGSRAAPPGAVARADSVRHSYSAADVEFMTGMIHHHGQALVMSRMAPTHGASERLQVLARRIINGQKGEIALMQDWLEDRNEPVADPESMGMEHGGDHGMMPGMLSAEELNELDQARGAEFDRLFLTYMIRHHEGALTMVNELFDTYGAGQGDAIFRLASSIAADQDSEIERMQSMLRQLLFESDGSP